MKTQKKYAHSSLSLFLCSTNTRTHYTTLEKKTNIQVEMFANHEVKNLSFYYTKTCSTLYATFFYCPVFLQFNLIAHETARKIKKVMSTFIGEEREIDLKSRKTMKYKLSL